jgi:ketosteroid isomerase-like protein
MSRENVEIVRRTIERFAQRGPEAVLATVHPNVEVHARIGEVYRGHDGALEFLREWLDPWDDYSIDSEEFFDAGDRVVVFIHQRGRGRKSGIEIDQRPALLFGLSGGQIIEWRTFTDREQALKAVGLGR